MNINQYTSTITLRVRKKVSDLIDIERSKFSMPKSSWITQAIVERLERLGYEINMSEELSAEKGYDKNK